LRRLIRSADAEKVTSPNHEASAQIEFGMPLSLPSKLEGFSGFSQMYYEKWLVGEKAHHEIGNPAFFFEALS